MRDSKPAAAVVRARWRAELRRRAAAARAPASSALPALDAAVTSWVAAAVDAVCVVAAACRWVVGGRTRRQAQDGGGCTSVVVVVVVVVGSHIHSTRASSTPASTSPALTSGPVDVKEAALGLTVRRGRVKEGGKACTREAVLATEYRMQVADFALLLWWTVQSVHSLTVPVVVRAAMVDLAMQCL